MELKREVVPPPAPGLDGSGNFDRPFSSVVRGGDFVFIGGLVSVDPQTGERRPGTVASETQQILSNLRQLIEAAGSAMSKVVKVNVVLHSMLEAPNMNDVYMRFFPDPPPARTVCGARLPDGVKVMIECTALA